MKIEIESSTYYDIPELVKLLGVTRKTLYNWVSQGRLKVVYKIGRKIVIPGSALKDFIESNKIKP